MPPRRCRSSGYARGGSQLRELERPPVGALERRRCLRRFRTQGRRLLQRGRGTVGGRDGCRCWDGNGKGRDRRPLGCDFSHDFTGDIFTCLHIDLDWYLRTNLLEDSRKILIDRYTVDRQRTLRITISLVASLYPRPIPDPDPDRRRRGRLGRGRGRRRLDGNRRRLRRRGRLRRLVARRSRRRVGRRRRGRLHVSTLIFRVILRLSGVISRLWRSLGGLCSTLRDLGRSRRNPWGVLRDRRKSVREVLDAPVGFCRQLYELSGGLDLSLESCDIYEFLRSSRRGCDSDRNQRRDADR
jgi:hypothetical protein